MLYSSRGKIFSCLNMLNIQGLPLAKCLKISCYMQLLTTLSNYCTEANSGPNLDNVSSLILSHNICIKSEIQEQEKLWYVAVW